MTIEINDAFVAEWDRLAVIVNARKNTDQGVKYDDDKPQYTLLPEDALNEVVKVLTYGAQKYSPDNWKRVPDLQNRYSDALYRHMYQSLTEFNDEESNLPHLAHGICCLLFKLQDALDAKKVDQ